MAKQQQRPTTTTETTVRHEYPIDGDDRVVAVGPSNGGPWRLEFPGDFDHAEQVYDDEDTAKEAAATLARQLADGEQPFTRTLAVTLSTDEHADLADAAAGAGLTVDEAARNAVLQWTADETERRLDAEAAMNDLGDASADDLG